MMNGLIQALRGKDTDLVREEYAPYGSNKKEVLTLETIETLTPDP